jgi:hypothetical protein
MQPKGAFTILVAFFLITVSSWASACELSCSLETSHSACLPPSQATANSQPTSASDTPMDMDMGPTHSAQENGKSEPKKSLPHHHPRMTSACANDMCSESSDSAYPAKNAAGAMQQQQAQFTAVAASLPPVMHAHPVIVDTSPPEKLKAGPSLFTLRI